MQGQPSSFCWQTKAQSVKEELGELVTGHDAQTTSHFLCDFRQQTVRGDLIGWNHLLSLLSGVNFCEIILYVLYLHFQPSAPAHTSKHSF